MEVPNIYKNIRSLVESALNNAYINGYFDPTGKPHLRSWTDRQIALDLTSRDRDLGDCPLDAIQRHVKTWRDRNFGVRD